MGSIMLRRVPKTALLMLLLGLVALAPASRAQTSNQTSTSTGNGSFTSGTSDVTVFPPQNCTSGVTNFIIWDGSNTTRCFPLPNCTINQALSYDGTNFTCVDGFAGTSTSTSTTTTGCQPTTITLSSAPCPNGLVGSIDTQQIVDCSGNSTVNTVTNCQAQFTATTVISCTPGDIETGKFVNGVFSFCTGSGCKNFLCTNTGLVAQ
jgi:hypothetical protein